MRERLALAAILAVAVLIASMVSVEIGISVALIELALGVALGNIVQPRPDPSWLVFIAGFASVVLTFLAGAEVDRTTSASASAGVDRDRRRLVRRPFVVATLIALGPLGWSRPRRR